MKTISIDRTEKPSEGRPSRFWRTKVREVRGKVSSKAETDLPPATKRVSLSEPIAPLTHRQSTPDPAPHRPRTNYDEDFALKLYFKEIGDEKLLSPSEEVRLAKRVRRGDEAARDQMIRANLRLVVKIAKDYEHFGMPLLDLINEGNIGLMRAVELFDPNKGAKLSTYSSWWIKQSIRRAIANQSKTIRLPIYFQSNVHRMRQAASKLESIFGREPTDDELAEELNLSASNVAQMRTATIRPASLDARLGDDDSSRLGDVVADESAASPSQLLEERNVIGLVLNLVDQLEPREAEILRRRFGLDGGNERTLSELGEDFGVTRERIRQLQNLALTKVRRRLEQIEHPKSTIQQGTGRSLTC